MTLITKQSHGAVVPHHTLTQEIPALKRAIVRTGGKGVRKAENRPSDLEVEGLSDTGSVPRRSSPVAGPADDDRGQLGRRSGTFSGTRSV
jgi:hypothetical protein